jgi:hypothetical protein
MLSARWWKSISWQSDALRAQRGASRQLKLIFHSVPIHPRYKAGLSRYIPTKNTVEHENI